MNSPSTTIETQRNDYDGHGTESEFEVEVIHSDTDVSHQIQGGSRAADDADAEQPNKVITSTDTNDYILDNNADNTAVVGNRSSSSWSTPTYKKRAVMSLATLFVLIFAITTGIGVAGIIAATKQASIFDTEMIQSNNNLWTSGGKSGKGDHNKVATCIIQPIQTIFSIKPSISCDNPLVPPTEKQFEKLYKNYMKECKDFWGKLLYRVVIAAIAFWENEKCDGGNTCSTLPALPAECMFVSFKAQITTEAGATGALTACVNALANKMIDDVGTTEEILEIADFPSSSNELI